MKKQLLGWTAAALLLPFFAADANDKQDAFLKAEKKARYGDYQDMKEAANGLNHPLKPYVETHFDIVLNPKNSGIFDVYVKSIGIPHSSDISHYPTSGVQDHQNEYVSVYSVAVNP